MTKEEVLALCSNQEEIDRVEAAYLAAYRFSKPSSFGSMDTEIQVKAEISKLVANYKKRTKARAKREAEYMAAKEQKEDKINKFRSLLTQAEEAGMTEDELYEAIQQVIKDRYNKSIEAQIELLKAKMIK